MAIQGVRELAPFLGASEEEKRFNALLDEIPGSLAYTELVHMLRQPIQYLHDRYDRYGEVFKTRLMFPAVWVLGAEAMKTVFVTGRHSFSYEKGYGKLSFAKIFEDSIITMDGEEAATARNILLPAVGRLGIRESTLKVQEIWSDATASLDDGKPRDAYDFVNKVTFNVSANALTGLSLGAELEEMFPLFAAMVDGTIQSVPVALPFSPLARGVKARAELFERFRPRIAAIRKQEPVGMVGLLAHHRDDNGELLPVDEVINHLLLLFWAGYDTTASAGSWCLHLLAHHPTWQDRLREEAEEVLQGKDFDLGAVAGLEQLSWFLREQERHRPSIIMFTRETVEEVEVAGRLLPKGVSVMYSPYMSHHLPTAFERPNVFDPGRWDPALGDRAAKASNLIGFGGGPRLCIGRNFALMQLRVMILTILRDYTLEPDDRTPHGRDELPMHRPVNSKIFFRRIQRDDA